MRNKKGFTLIELIVVIAIIGVLTAILVPSFISYVEKAKKTAANTEASSIQTTVQTVINADESLTFEAADGVCFYTNSSSQKVSAGCTVKLVVDLENGVSFVLAPLNQEIQVEEGSQTNTYSVSLETFYYDDDLEVDNLTELSTRTQLVIKAVYKNVTGKALFGIIKVESYETPLTITYEREGVVADTKIVLGNQ